MNRKILATLLLLFSFATAYGIQGETEWVKFTAPKGLFSLQSPHEPKLDEPTDGKPEQPPHSRFNDFGDGYGFVIEYFEGLTIADPEKYLDATRDGVVSKVNGTLTGQDKITLDGYPGREVSLSITVENGTVVLVRTRIYVVGTSMFSVSYVWRKDGDPVVRAKMGEKFFSSVKIKPKE
jgi:hypothetical protein